MKRISLKPLVSLKFLLLICMFSCLEETDLNELKDDQSSIPCFADDAGDCEGESIFDNGSTGGGGSSGGGSNNSDPMPDRFQYFHRGNSSKNLWTSYSITGESNWQGDSRISSTSETDRGPAAVFCNNLIYVFYKGESFAGTGDNIYYRTSTDGSTWATEIQLLNTQTRLAPAVVERDGDLLLYYKSVDQGIFFKRLSNGRWSSSREALTGTSIIGGRSFVLPKRGSTDPLSVSFFNEEVVISFVGSYGNLEYARSTGFAAFEDVERLGNFGDNIQGRDGVSTVVFKNQLYWIYNGKNTKDLYVTRTSDFDSFETFKIRVNGRNAETDSAPRVATDGEKLVLVYEEEYGSRIYYAYSSDGETWNGNTRS